MTVPGYTSRYRTGVPIYGEPFRDVFSEGVWNIAKIVKDLITEPDPRFRTPLIHSWSEGRSFKWPTEWPLCEVFFRRFLGVQDREASRAPSETWRMHYVVRYLYEEINPDTIDLDVTAQITALCSIFTYYRNLNDWAEGEGVEILEASQDVEKFIKEYEPLDITNIVGGEIILQVDHRFKVVTSEDGGQTERRMEQPTGPAY
jgi:hypothetical protein